MTNYDKLTQNCNANWAPGCSKFRDIWYISSLKVADTHGTSSANFGSRKQMPWCVKLGYPSLNHHEMSWDLFHARVREESQNLKPGQHGINLLMLRVLGPLLQRSWDVDGETGNQPHDHLSTEGMGIDGIHGIHGIWMLEQWSVFHPKFIAHSKKHFESSTLHIFLTL